MTDELEDQRRALAAEIEHLRIQRDQLKAAPKPAGGRAARGQSQARAHREWTSGAAEEREDQREADRGRSARRAVEVALERQRIADHTAEQDEHLAAINGSIEKSAVALQDLGRQFAAAAAQRVKELAVAEALAKALKDQQEGGLTSKRLYISVVAIVLPMILTLVVVLVKG